MLYQRDKAVHYAHSWAYQRNPDYLDFGSLGGDCTNFISQCLHAGGAPMNPTETFGWYYKSAYNRAPAWTGVEFLYSFLIKNRGVGPYAAEISIEQVQPGDIIQLSFTPDLFAHSLIAISTGEVPALENILIATHSNDSYNRPLSTYLINSYRCLQVDIRV